MALAWIEGVLKERVRVIDHYQRLFAIICGSQAQIIVYGGPFLRNEKIPAYGPARTRAK